MLTDIEKQIINILFLSGEEMAKDKLREILSQDIREDVFIKIKEHLNSIGLDILQGADKVKIVTAAEYVDLLKSFTHYEYEGDLTPAALQVITIISYMGESSDADISFIRGIQSNQILRALTTRGLLKKNDNKYLLTTEALGLLGISDISTLPEYKVLSEKIKQKLKDNLNG